MRLVEGARAIRDDLPSSATTEVAIPLEAGDDQGTRIARLSSLLVIRDAQARALQDLAGGAEGADDPVITIGGDCGVELASVSHAIARDPGTTVLWFDAHPDINIPEDSPSGAFHGMVLRTLLGDGEPALLPERPLDPARLILVGTRALDDPEAAFLDGVMADGRPAPRLLAGAELTAQSLIAAIEASGATSVYIHIDLDVLDPAEIGGIGYPEPFGLAATELVALLKAVRERFPLAGAGLMEFAPSSPEQAIEDLPTILRLLGALSAPASSDSPG